jgi:predicted secreted protein
MFIIKNLKMFTYIMILICVFNTIESALKSCKKIDDKPIHTLVYRVPEENSGKSYNINAKNNWEVDIFIRGNESTGYEWILSDKYSKYNKNNLKPLNLNTDNSTNDYETDPKPAQMVGVPGQYNFKFRCLRVDTNKLTFIYKRAWEDEIEEQFNVFIKVK